MDGDDSQKMEHDLKICPLPNTRFIFSFSHFWIRNSASLVIFLTNHADLGSIYFSRSESPKSRNNHLDMAAFNTAKNRSSFGRPSYRTLATDCEPLIPSIWERSTSPAVLEHKSAETSISGPPSLTADDFRLTDSNLAATKEEPKSRPDKSCENPFTGFGWFLKVPGEPKHSYKNPFTEAMDDATSGDADGFEDSQATEIAKKHTDQIKSDWLTSDLWMITRILDTWITDLGTAERLGISIEESQIKTLQTMIDKLARWASVSPERRTSSMLNR